MKLKETINQMVKEALDDLSREPLNEIWLDEAEYPESFSFDEMKDLPSAAAVIRYLESHLGKKLGKGSARIVFPIDKETVLKVAINDKGLAQNGIEIDAGKIGYEHIAEVHDFDKDSIWLEMERAERFRKTSEWPKLVGLPIRFDQWFDVLRNYINSRKPRRSKFGAYIDLDPGLVDEVEESEMFNDVVSMIVNHDMAIGDMGRPSSWGIVTRNGKRVPVLVDFGITSDILKTYYWG